MTTALAPAPVPVAPLAPLGHNRSYWQIAAGSEGRTYADAFLRFGMAFVGGQGHCRTMTEVQPGDVVILKRGMSEILAVGEVVARNGQHSGIGDKAWLCDFDGWNLEAYCHVNWRVPTQPVPVSGLTRTTIQRVHQRTIRDVADQILSSAPKAPPPVPEPGPTKDVEDTTILRFLIRSGLRPGAAEELTVALNRIRLLASYYYDNLDWAQVREHETRTFLIVPLLLALGWAEQQIKIELPVPGTGRADLACFLRPFRGNGQDECALIIETKGFSQGLDYAPEQARGYARQFPSCRVVLVSNGYCYKAYTRDEEGMFGTTPAAYLNLLQPQDRYPLDPGNVNGGLEVLSLLLP
ncbi:hypothetical protein [Azospirillum sp.]|uniref:hypothetical protein n=1 Tax=Azospirillum sp. TaxID=34012 RepID=UPI003D756FE0